MSSMFYRRDAASIRLSDVTRGLRKASSTAKCIGPLRGPRIMKNKFLCICMLVAFAISGTAQKIPPRQMENLSRGVVAVNQGDGKVFVGWRMFGTDPDNIACAFCSYAGKDDYRIHLNGMYVDASYKF